jgi:hypothetical protein
MDIHAELFGVGDDALWPNAVAEPPAGHCIGL